MMSDDYIFVLAKRTLTPKTVDILLNNNVWMNDDDLTVTLLECSPIFRSVRY